MKIKPGKVPGDVVVETRGEEVLPAGTVPELHLKRILVPTDFSDCSNKAVQYGRVLARQFDADLLVAHVVEAAPPHFVQPSTGLDPISGRLMPGDMADVELAMRAAAERQLEELKKSLGEVRTQSILTMGGAHQQIVELAREHQIDLVILGTHGRTGLKRALLGSTAEKVVRHAPCPVMVVRMDEHDFVETPESESQPTSKPAGTSIFT